MASFIFKKQASSNITRRYSVTEHRDGRGLGRRMQYTGAQMLQVTPGIPRNWPVGTDTKAPVLPHEAR